jgi:hypothetical protein
MIAISPQPLDLACARLRNSCSQIILYDCNALPPPLPTPSSFAKEAHDRLIVRQEQETIRKQGSRAFITKQPCRGISRMYRIRLMQAHILFFVLL